MEMENDEDDQYYEHYISSEFYDEFQSWLIQIQCKENAPQNIERKLESKHIRCRNDGYIGKQIITQISYLKDAEIYEKGYVFGKEFGFKPSDKLGVKALLVKWKSVSCDPPNMKPPGGKPEFDLEEDTIITYKIEVFPDGSESKDYYKVKKYDTIEDLLEYSQEEEVGNVEQIENITQWCNDFGNSIITKFTENISPYKYANLLYKIFKRDIKCVDLSKEHSKTYFMWYKEENKSYYSWKKVGISKVRTQIKRRMLALLHSIDTNRNSEVDNVFAEKIEYLKKATEGGSKKIGKYVNEAMEDFSDLIEDTEFETKLDVNPDIYVVENGVIDFKGEHIFRQRRRSDNTQLQANVEYDPRATCPKWEAFLLDITNHNEEWVEHLQLMLGYGILTGHTNLQKFIIFYGLGGNGKGVIMKVLDHISGSYGKKGNIDSIKKTSKSKDGSGASADLAMLKGLRFVYFEEGENDIELGGTYKDLSGDAQIYCRPLYGAPVNIKLFCQIILATNNKPKVDGKAADKRRIEFHNFPNEYVDEDKIKKHKNVPKHMKLCDPDLDEQLLLESAGILNWLIEGAKRYYTIDKKTIKIPQVIREENDAYFDIASSSWTTAFIITYNDIVEERMTNNQIIATIHEYCSAKTVKLPTKNEIKSTLKEKGLKFHPAMKYKDGGVSKTGGCWVGIKVKEVKEEDVEEDVAPPEEKGEDKYMMDDSEDD
jgi:P4 family phage/plasmid primase-like protien